MRSLGCQGSQGQLVSLDFNTSVGGRSHRGLLEVAIPGSMTASNAKWDSLSVVGVLQKQTAATVLPEAPSDTPVKGLLCYMARKSFWGFPPNTMLCCCLSQGKWTDIQTSRAVRQEKGKLWVSPGVCGRTDVCTICDLLHPRTDGDCLSR
jgi:hypothetical protein